MPKKEFQCKEKVNVRAPDNNLVWLELDDTKREKCPFEHQLAEFFSNFSSEIVKPGTNYKDDSYSAKGCKSKSKSCKALNRSKKIHYKTWC